MMPSDDRIQAVTEFGFTERQARFLVLVMSHAGVASRGSTLASRASPKERSATRSAISSSGAAAPTLSSAFTTERGCTTSIQKCCTTWSARRQSIPPPGVTAPRHRAADDARRGTHRTGHRVGNDRRREGRLPDPADSVGRCGHAAGVIAGGRPEHRRTARHAPDRCGVGSADSPPVPGHGGVDRHVPNLPAGACRTAPSRADLDATDHFSPSARPRLRRVPDRHPRGTGVAASLGRNRRTQVLLRAPRQGDANPCTRRTRGSSTPGTGCSARLDSRRCTSDGESAGTQSSKARHHPSSPRR